MVASFPLSLPLDFMGTLMMRFPFYLSLLMSISFTWSFTLQIDSIYFLISLSSTSESTLDYERELLISIDASITGASNSSAEFIFAYEIGSSTERSKTYTCTDPDLLSSIPGLGSASSYLFSSGGSCSGSGIGLAP